MLASTETLISLAVYREQLAPIADGLISMCMSDKVCRLVPSCALALRGVFQLHSQCRVPGESMDTLVRHMPSRHVVVICKGHVYAVDVFDESGRVYSLEQLYQ